MAEEFHAGVCGGTWWNSSKNLFASPCSMGIGGDLTGSNTNFLWSSLDVLDMKAKSSYEEEDAATVTATTTNTNNNSSVSAGDDNSMGFHVQKLHQAAADSDSTLQMMGFGISSSSTSTSDWNQSILGRLSSAESNYSSMLPEEMNSISRMQQSYSTESSINETIFKPVYLHQDFSSSSSSSSSPSISASYGFPNSTLLQSLFESAPAHDDSPPPHHHQLLQQSLLNNQSMNYMSTYTNCNSQDQLSPSNWSKTVSPLLKPSLPKQHFWNSSSSFPAPVNDIMRPSFSSSSRSQFGVPCFQDKSNCSRLTPKSSMEEIRDSGSMMKKASSELPVSKRPRIETPSPLPTFKVRKEKLGDRITALQQLVSPFGKTDTASVLHEAIEYIKFLHDQVSALSTPYMKQGAPTHLHQQGCHEKLKEVGEGPIKQDLRSRGLCLVPISSTFPVANETPADFWTPTFGGTFR